MGLLEFLRILQVAPGDIERQEAEGQKELCSSLSLPKQMEGSCTREKLESWGIVFGNDIDELFIEAKLPSGWKIKPTDHSMWSDLIDADGKTKAKVFYKAAFYDRRAHIVI